MKKRTQRDRFVQKLAEQLQALQVSANAYDSGVESEAYRIAVSLRVLFHKTASSTPLLEHLKMRNVIMLSSDGGAEDYTAYVSVVLSLGSGTPVSCRPKLGTAFAPLPLYKWWHEQSVYQFDQRTYTRRDLIRVAANQDGGAHVDAKLQAFYEDLASGVRNLGIDGRNLVYSNGAPYDQSVVQYPQNTHVAMIRQFGHEVLCSASHFRWMQHVTGLAP